MKAGENMKKRVILFSLAIITVGLLVYNKSQISNFRINKVDILSNKIEEDIRIAQITDFHSNYRVDLDKLKKTILEFNPHIIALTGDLIDQKTEDISTAVDLVDKINEVGVPMYFVEGNHEISNRLRREFLKELLDRDVVILQNQSESIIINGKQVRIFGAEFYVEEFNYKELLKDADQSQLNILLSHSPVKPAWYADGKVDLILSGHTHGGQIRLPFIGGLVSPGQGFLPEYDKGLMTLEEGTKLYIDSGIGNSILPIRFLNPIQFSEITIKRQ